MFDHLVLQQQSDFRFTSRSRRPPLDNINALLSFAYTLLTRDCTAALESAGLDPYIGFMHRPRPGRRSLALDLMEELRAVYADRFVLSCVNRKIITAKHLQKQESGAVLLTDDGRRAFLSAWQSKKQEQITHPFLKEKIPWGLVPYVQALLLARTCAAIWKRIRRFSGSEVKMLVLITYDVNTETAAGKKRLRKVAKKCVDHGQRVQNSVFECLLTAAQYVTLKAELTALIEPETDSLRFYRLGNQYKQNVEHVAYSPPTRRIPSCSSDYPQCEAKAHTPFPLPSHQIKTQNLSFLKRHRQIFSFRVLKEANSSPFCAKTDENFVRFCCRLHPEGVDRIRRGE